MTGNSLKMVNSLQVGVHLSSESTSQSLFPPQECESFLTPKGCSPVGMLFGPFNGCEMGVGGGIDLHRYRFGCGPAAHLLLAGAAIRGPLHRH